MIENPHFYAEKPVKKAGLDRIENSVEEEIERQSRWFGGVFEAGGGMGIIARSDRRVYPFISFSDNTEKVTAVLQEKFGGSRYKRKGINTWEWRLADEKNKTKVFFIASSMVSYAPSRKDIINAFYDLEKAKNSQDKIQIADRIRGYDRLVSVKEEDYMSLIEDPQFLAGIFDSRGDIYWHMKKGKIVPLLSINTKNRALLEAVKKKFGGYLELQMSKANERKPEKDFKSIKHEALSLRIGERSLLFFIQTIKQHVLLKKNLIENLQ